MPTMFTGTLNSNEIFSSIYNMIISQAFYADRLSGMDKGLVAKFKTDGTLYGDTKLFYAADVLKTYVWGNYAEAANLLAVDKPANPVCQKIVLDQFRQVRLTLDNYLSKRAWGDEYAFSNFRDVMLSYISKTKKLYETLLINTYVGTVVSTATKAVKSINVTTAVGTATGEEKNRLTAQAIARGLADLLVDMGDVSRDYNEYSFMDAFNTGDLMVVWNAEKVNEITKFDLPTIFHQEGLMEKFEEEKLPARYFGTVITSSNISSYSAQSPAAGKPINSSTGAYTPGSNNANGCVRSLVEKDYTVSGTAYHCFPGDELVAGATIVASGNFEPGEVYINEANVICKVIHKDAIKFMSAFEVATEFFNPRSLTSSHYLTWGYSKPDYLKSLPVIKVLQI